MDFSDWLEQQKTDLPTISDFIGRIESLFGENGFNSAEFEKKIIQGINKIERDVDSSLTPGTTPNA